MAEHADLPGLAFEGRLLTAPEDMAAFLTDWRRIWHGQAIAVAQPETTDGVAAVVRWCRDNSVRVVPQGGNTGLSGGATPSSEGRNLVLSLARLNRVRAVDPINNTMTVEAGCILTTLQETAAQAGRLFPLSLGAEGSCMIGGNLATNAGGTAVLSYGNTRELCLGLEVVTADGEIWESLRGLRKDNSGYDLRDLFIGSEGTLGVITAAVMKLFPAPVGKAVGWVAVASPDDALALLNTARNLAGASLTAFELISGPALDMVLRHHSTTRNPLSETPPWCVLIEVGDLRSQEQADAVLQAVLEQAFEAETISDGVASSSLAQAQALWHLRELISDTQPLEGANIKHDVSVPISSIGTFTAQALDAVAAVTSDLRPIVFGHLGDGNLHFNLCAAPGVAYDVAMGHQAALNEAVHSLAVQHGGSISAEHGLGVLRRDEAVRRKSPVELKLAAAIKAALDPQAILNPGKGLV